MERIWFEVFDPNTPKMMTWLAPLPPNLSDREKGKVVARRDCLARGVSSKDLPEQVVSIRG